MTPDHKLHLAQRVVARWTRRARKDRAKVIKARHLFGEVLKALKRPLFYPHPKGFVLPIPGYHFVLLFDKKSRQRGLSYTTGDLLLPSGDASLGKLGLIIVPLIWFTDPQNPQPKEIAEGVKRWKVLFIHEITHHLDEMAHNLSQKLPKEDPDSDWGGYINDPRELNAYFIQALSQASEPFEDITEALDYSNPEKASHQEAVARLKDWMNLYVGDFQSFRKSVMEGYMHKLDLADKNVRKLEKRVYDWWYKATQEAKRIWALLLDLKDPLALTLSKLNKRSNRVATRFLWERR